MKNNRLSTELSSLTLLIIVIMSSLVGYYAWRAHSSPHLSPVVPTNTISSTQSIGGTPADTSSHHTDGVTASSESQAARTPSSTKQPIAQPTVPTIASSSPKQADIKKTIATEYQYHALQAPNDPMYATFIDSGGATHTPFALQHLGAPSVWDTTTGSQVVIADVDTGFALNHEDLATQWYQNSGEMGSTTLTQDTWGNLCRQGVDKSINGCDDDGNGYVDDWRGWNFAGSYQPTATPCAAHGAGTYVPNNNPMAGKSGTEIEYQESKTCFNIDQGDPFAAVSHGTSTAGILGAASNNSKGIATLNWNVKVMPLQVLTDDGSGWTSSIVSAIHYAVDNGATIINMSLGGDNNDPALRDAIDYAYAHNVIVVAAAGNCGTGNESGCTLSKPGAMGYPALYNHVISVGATDKNDARASFSSYGPSLDIVAPGYGELISPLVNRPLDGSNNPSSDPLSFNYTNAYSAGLAGTSFATPYTANALSLIKSVKPSYSVDEVTALVDGSATKVANMSGKVYTNEYGHGLVNAAKIATIAQSLASSSDTPVLAQTGDFRSEHSFSDTASMNSGCTVTANRYCTVWLHNEQSGYDRYLPYATSPAGTPGWQWTGNTLTSGMWDVRAVQGSSISASYMLFSK